MLDDPAASGKIVFAIYVAAGVPVAWLHIRQQRMLQPVQQVQHSEVQSLLLFTLAAMWPLLLFSMALTHFLSKPRRPRKPVAGPPESGSDC